MRRLQTFVIVLLALATLGTGYYAWSQAREIADLKQALADAARPRVEARKRAWREATIHPGEPPADRPAGEDDEHRGEDRARDTVDIRARGPAAFRAMMENPEYQKLMALEQKGRLDTFYSALFKKLRLTPAQLDKFKDLLVEKQGAFTDVLMAARAQGLNPRTDPDGFRALVASTMNDIDAGIRGAIGDDAFATYQSYEQTMPYRNVVGQLDARLSYSASPLTEAQSDQLVQILADANPRPVAENSPRAMLGGAGLRGASGSLNGDAMARAQGVLTPDQYSALQSLQQEQQVQAQLRKLMQQQLQSTAPASAAPAVELPANAPRVLNAVELPH